MHLIQIPVAANQAGERPLEHLWPKIAPLLEKAIAHNEGATTLEYEAAELASLRKQLWVIISDDKDITAAGITSLTEFPGGKKAANIELLGGESTINHWFDLRDRFEDWAKKEGCNEVRIYARKGWARKLPDYKIQAYVMSKQL